MRSVTALGLIAVVAAFATPRDAVSGMHLRLTGSRPARDSVLATAPTQICLWFSQRPTLRLSSVTLTGPQGAVALAKPTMAVRDSAPIIARITGPVPPGKYVVAWRTAGADGHPIRGTIPFTVR